MLSFCEVMAGADRGSMCGGRPVGKCTGCGLTICQSHSEIIDGKIFCFDCSSSYEKQLSRFGKVSHEKLYQKDENIAAHTDTDMDTETDRIFIADIEDENY